MKPFNTLSEISPKHIEQQIREITSITSQKFQELEHIGVIGGISGIALLQFYAAQYFDEDQYAEHGVDCISTCVDMINNGYAFPNYSQGIAGFGWTLQHLSEKQFINLDTNELLVPFDDYLYAQMDLELSKGHYDFLKGASGYAFYFLKRYKNSEGNLKLKYKAILEKFVQDLKDMAFYEGDCIMWESILNRRNDAKGFNLSLSHGIPSMVYLLSKLHSETIKPDITTKLLKGATAYILKYEDTSKTQMSCFPNWIEPNVEPIYNSRVGWCYGDIGIGKALYHASKALGSDSLREKSLATLLHSAERLAPETSLVNDAGFCHGSFGNAHIFKRLSHIHQNPEFLKAAQFWIHDGLNRHTGDKDQPYRQFTGPEANLSFEINLLEGIAGIGLSLIDYISPEENTWDECLMLS